VEGIISELQADGGCGSDGGADESGVGEAGGWACLDALTSGADQQQQQQQQQQALAEELALLGFAQSDADAAAAAVAGGGGGAASLSAALDWLCMRLPEERLPKNFAPGEPVPAGEGPWAAGPCWHRLAACSLHRMTL
jgi:hypothetical protein